MATTLSTPASGHHPRIVSMHAVRIHGYGGPDALVYEAVPRPDPGPGELRVRVRAAGVNPVDWKVRAGYLAAYLPHRFPLTLGWDLSGMVDAVGPAVEHGAAGAPTGAAPFAVGDAIVARSEITRDGAYAEYAIVRSDEATPKPPALDDVTAAALPLAAMTAWEALFEAAGLDAGHTVLVHGGAGGVGHLAVQLAHGVGARVVATAATEDRDFVGALGADTVVDYTTERFEDHARGVDVVLDLVGGETRQRSLDLLTAGGTLVTTVEPPDAAAVAAAAARGVRLTFVNGVPDAARLARVVGLAGAGRLRPAVHEVLPLAEARRAHELSQAGRVRGKLVLQPHS